MTREQVSGAIAIVAETRPSAAPDDLAAAFLVGISYAALVLDRSEHAFEELMDVVSEMAKDYPPPKPTEPS